MLWPGRWTATGLAGMCRLKCKCELVKLVCETHLQMCMLWYVMLCVFIDLHMHSISVNMNKIWLRNEDKNKNKNM